MKLSHAYIICLKQSVVDGLYMAHLEQFSANEPKYSGTSI